MFSCLFFSVFDKFNFSSMGAAIGEKYLQTLRGRSNFWPSLFVWFFFSWNDSLSLLNIHTIGPEMADPWTHAKTYGWAWVIRPIFLTIYIYLSLHGCATWNSIMLVIKKIIIKQPLDAKLLTYFWSSPGCIKAFRLR